MKTFLMAALLLAAGAAFAQDETPRQRIDAFLAAGSEAGSLFAQAGKEGVDYRKLLAGARGKDGPSLAGIFAFTGKGALRDEAAEVNGEILLQLMRLWGDQSYGHVLAGETARTQDAVRKSIGFVWAEEEPPAKKYPVTFGAGVKR